MARISEGVAADGGRAGGVERVSPGVAASLLASAPWRVARVGLVVRDLERLAAFYRDAIGLATVSRGPGLVRLGVGDAVLLELCHDPTARAWSTREAGLFHTAFLLPDRDDLGAWLAHAAARDRLREAGLGIEEDDGLTVSGPSGTLLRIVPSSGSQAR